MLKLLYQMNKSPQYNRQTEPKQRKSEVEEICIYFHGTSMEDVVVTQHHLISLYLRND